MDYLDFEIEIGQRLEPRSTGRRQVYPVAVLHSPDGVGEPRGEMVFTLTGDQQELQLAKLQNALLRSGGGTTMRRIASLDERPVQEFGQTLFGSLFAGEVGASFDFAQRTADKQGKGLRLKLRIQSPELAVLPWEFLYDPRGTGTFMALSPERPLVRYVEVSRVISTLAVEPPLKVLGVVASPSDLDPLDVPLERRRLERALEGLRADGRVELTWLEGQTWQDLRQAMWGGPWHILHFIGHGDFSAKADEGVIALCDETGRSHLLTATQTSRLLAGQSSLRLAVLNSCDGARGSNHDLFSSTAVTLVSSGVPAVVAMQYEISDEAAIQFGSSFYRAVAHGIPVDAAVAEARIAITMRTSDTAEWGIPVLYMRSPDGRLFDLQPPAAAPRPRKTDEAASAVPQTRQVEEPVEPEKASRKRQFVADPRVQELLGERWTKALQEFWTEHWEEAAELLQAILDAQPDYPGAAAKRDEARRQARLTSLYRSASQACDAHDWDTAINQFQELVKLAPAYRDAALRLADADCQRELASLYSEARQLSAAGAWDAILPILQRARSIDQRFEDTDGLEARATQALADQHRQRALEAILSRGLANLEGKCWLDAIAAFEELLKRQPDHAGAAELLERAKDEQTRQAEGERQAALREQVAQLMAAAQRGLDSAKWPEAIQQSQEVLSLDGSNQAASRTLAEARRMVELDAQLEQGLSLARGGQWAEAIAAFDAVYRQQPNYRDVAQALGRARDELARLEAAARQAAQAAADKQVARQRQAQAAREAAEREAAERQAEERAAAEREAAERSRQEQAKAVEREAAQRAAADREAAKPAQLPAVPKTVEITPMATPGPVAAPYAAKPAAGARPRGSVQRPVVLVGAVAGLFAVATIVALAAQLRTNERTLVGESRPTAAPTLPPEATQLPLTPVTVSAAEPQIEVDGAKHVATIASVPTPAHTSTPAPTATPTVDMLWQSTLAALDLLWGTDWPKAIDLLTTFKTDHAGYAPVQDKLYAALVLQGKDLLAADATEDAIAALVNARTLLPDRAEADEVLTSLTPTPVPAAPPDPIRTQPRPTPIPVRQPAPAQQPAPVAPRPAATSTRAPFAP